MRAEELWERVTLYVERASYRLFGNGPDAEDFQQDAAMICMKFPERYPDLPDVSLERLAHRAIWNHGIDLIRHRTAQWQATKETARKHCELAKPGGQGSIEAREILEKVDLGLSAKDREVYSLYSKGWKGREIATELGKNHSTVRSSICRIRQEARRFNK